MYRKFRYQPIMLYASHKLKQLLFHLSCDLNEKGRDPFAKRIIILPDRSMKTIIEERIVDEMAHHIAMNIRWRDLPSAIQELANPAPPPSPFALSLGITKLLLKKQREGDRLLAKEIPSLSFLDGQQGVSPLLLHQVAERIGSTLHHLLYYQPELLEESPSHPLLAFFQELFVENPSWRTPLQCLLTETFSVELYFFGFLYLPLQIYQKLGELPLNALHGYCYQPTSLYLKDHLSKGAKASWLKKAELASPRYAEALEESLSHDHPLLASFGESYVRTQLFLEEENALFSQPFLEQEQTLLALIKRDLLLAQPEERALSHQKELSLSDEKENSLLFFVAESEQKEVEAIMRMVTTLIVQDHLPPSSITITAIDYERYLPHIEAIESTLPWMVEKAVPLSRRGAIGRAFALFVDLLETDSSPQKMIALFFFDPVRRAFNLTEEEVTIVSRFIDHFHLHNPSKEIKKAILAEDYEPSYPLSFEEFSELLILLFTMDPPLMAESRWRGYPFTPSFQNIEGVAHLLSSLSSLLEKIDSLKVASLSIEAWVEELSLLLQRLFLPLGEEEEEEYICILQRLKEWSLIETQGTFPLRAILKELDGIAKSRLDRSSKGNLERLFFLPFRSAALTGNRIVIVIGFDENVVLTVKNHLLPTTLPMVREREREGKALFLNLLLNSQDSLYISYARYQGGGGRECKSHPIVEEFRDYLQATYHRSFEDRPVTQSFSSHSSKPSKGSNSFLNLFPITNSTLPATMTLPDIELSLKDPLKLYLRQCGGILLPADGMKEEEREPLWINSLTRYQTRYDSSRGITPLHSLFAKGNLPPQGVVKAALKEVSPKGSLESTFSLLLCEKLTTSGFHDRSLLLVKSPILSIGDKKITVTGEIAPLSTHGIILLSSSFRQAIPKLLLLARVEHEIPCTIKLTVQGGEKIVRSEELRKELLEELLLYTHRAMEEPSPLYSTVIAPLAQGKVQEAAQKLQEEGEITHSKALRRVLHLMERNLIEEWLSRWQKEAKLLEELPS